MTTVIDSAGSAVTIRRVEATDYDRVIRVVDGWWGKAVTDLLPRLFCDHFADSSLIGEAGGEIAAFFCAFLSSQRPDEAYVHFVGVAPPYRRTGLARSLYERFFAVMREAGRCRVHCVTSPTNATSIAFHTAIGFRIVPGDATTAEGVSFHREYDGPGRDRVLFEREV